MDFTNPFSDTFKKSPLTLDRIFEGRPIAAQHSPLLNVPVEVLSHIIRYIETDRESLASLALVNSDCRQLARSCQYANVVIDYSIRSYCLFGLLIHEATERSISDGLTRQPSIGACIRYLTASSEHGDDELDVIARLRPRPSDAGEDGYISSSLTMDQWRGLYTNLTSKVGNIYDPSMLLIVTSLPHLEILSWTNRLTIDRHLFSSLGASRIKHLKLRCSIDSDTMAVEIYNGNSWPLLSLDIDVRWGILNDSELTPAAASTFFNSLFQACSSTLRFLKLSHMDPGFQRQKPLALTADFPHLSCLHLAPITPLDQSTLRSLLQSRRLSTLVLDFSDSDTRQCLNQIGYYPSLHTLIWTGIQIPGTASLRCLERNNHLTAFGTEYNQSPSLLRRVLPMLSSFANLKALSLQWEGTTIPDSSLLSLASVASLENLHISSGTQDGWRHDWFIDHDAVRSHLSPLRKLKRILITRDSYPMNNSLQGENEAGYYSYRIPDAANLIDFMEDPTHEEQTTDNFPETVWESVHRKHMAWHAEKYAVPFPELEWIHLGQLSFSFEQAVDGKKTATVLDFKRNDRFPVMETMFGLSEL